MNKLGIPLLTPMPVPSGHRGPARPGSGGGPDFDRALDQVLDTPVRPDDPEESPPEPDSGHDRSEAAADGGEHRPERSSRPESHDAATATAADEGEVELEVELDTHEPTGATVDGATVGGSEKPDTSTSTQAPTGESLLIFDLTGRLQPSAGQEPAATAPAASMDEQTTDDEVPTAAATVLDAGPTDTTPLPTATETPRASVAAEATGQDEPAAVGQPSTDAAEALPADQLGATRRAGKAATETDPLLELHGTTAPEGGAAPVAPATLPGSTAGQVSTSPSSADRNRVAAPAEGIDGASEAGAEPGGTEATVPADAASAEPAPAPQIRPTTPAPANPPIGSTQATVSNAASARSEPTISVTEAQQAMSSTADGIDAPEVWRQVQRAVGSLRTNVDGDQQLTIRLRPAELGAVMVRVIASETGTNISVVAETSAAANQLNQQRQQLTSELEGSGLRGVSVDIGAQTGDGPGPGDARTEGGDGDGTDLGRVGRGADQGRTDPRFPNRLRPISSRAQLIDLDL